MAGDRVPVCIHRLSSVLFVYLRRQADSVCSRGHSSRSASPEIFTLPPPDMQLIIDKMASYVAKNGRDFEAIVKSKGKEDISLEPESVRVVNTSTDNTSLELAAIHPAWVVFCCHFVIPMSHV